MTAYGRFFLFEEVGIMTAIQKMVAAGLLMVAWGALVIMGHAPAAEFITGLRDALIALGVFTATIVNPKE